MKYPQCQICEVATIDSSPRMGGLVTWRKKKCKRCGFQFVTIEREEKNKKLWQLFRNVYTEYDGCRENSGEKHSKALSAVALEEFERCINEWADEIHEHGVSLRAALIEKVRGL